MPSAFQTQLETGLESAKNAIVQEVAERNSHYFETEMDKLETWADDLKQGLERELQELDKEIKAVKKEAQQAGNLDSKVELHKKVKELEKRRNNKRKQLFDAQDEIDERKENVIGKIEAQLEQDVSVAELFTIRWQIIQVL